MGLIRETGFTLAEVLITLGIIGIVAAMTLPTIIQKKNTKELEVSFKKAYANLYNAFNLVIADEYPVFELTPSETNPDGLVTYKSRFIEEMKKKYIQLKPISNKDKKLYNNSTTNFLRAKTAHYPGCSQSMNSNNGFITPDGSAISMLQNCYALWVTIDTNGIKKGPNAFGHDIFIFRAANNTYKLLPANHEAIGNYDDDGNLTDTDIYYDEELCSKTNNRDINGSTCATFAISNTCPWDESKTYWECLP